MLKSDRPLHAEHAPEPDRLPALAAAPAPDFAVPNYPSAAPGVHLVGEMRDSGFLDRQWLVQRDGRFIQVSELLYRVLELADGTRTFEEIAAGVTDATEWMVSAEQVRLITCTKLMPMRLIASARPFVVARADAEDDWEDDPEDSALDDPPGSLSASAQPRSPLAVYARRRVLAPRLIDPVTSVLQLLYMPPVLGLMLALIVVAQVWMFRAHGRDVIAGLVQALYTPGLLLLVLALVVIATLFHEFGHASALRYGGGQVRGIGVGIYIYFPVFYSDVTDSYRLSRWARVRTDLGGFYFSLIFTLGMIALYTATGLTFPLLLVALIDFDILYQCIPFVRMDGYWLLADLTGIPDLFTYMGPLLRGFLPIRRLRGNQGPLRLKRWVKMVFAIYSLVTIPLLALFWFSLIKNLPTLLVTTERALVQQGLRFAGALHTGAIPILSLVVIQAFLITLTAVGTTYMAYSLGYRSVHALWIWSRTSPLRLVFGLALGLGALAGLALLWMP